MQTLDLRARSVSEIVDGAFQLYRRDALHYILATAVAYAPGLIGQVVLLWMGASPNTPGIGFWLLTAGNFVGFTLMSGVLVRYSAEAYFGRPVELGSVVREVLPRFWALLAGGILKTAAFAIGLVLFVFPGLYFIARYFAVTPAIVLEQAGVGAAFARSGALSRGRKRHIFNTLALVVIIYLLGSIAVGVLVELTGMNGQVPQSIFTAAYTIVAYPLIGITEMLLYYDARIRAEGYDIEVMAGALEASPAV